MELHNASDDDSDDDFGYFATMSSADINAAFIEIQKDVVGFLPLAECKVKTYKALL